MSVSIPFRTTEPFVAAALRLPSAEKSIALPVCPIFSPAARFRLPDASIDLSGPPCAMFCVMLPSV